MHIITEEQIDKIHRIAGERVRQDEYMSGHTSFRVGGPAEVYIEAPRNIFLAVLKFASHESIPCTILGNGSNVLVGDKGIAGIVLSTSGMNEIYIDNEANTITAESGTLLSRMANRACEAGLSGLEFAGGIPGTVGGAVYMNAGAYGNEISDVICEAECVDCDGNIVRLKNDELELSYRHSVIGEHGLIVLSAIFKLTPKRSETIRSKMQEFAALRAEKQPLDYPSAGSAFKRPSGHFAAALIEEAGLKGYTVGNAAVSEKHSGFIINKGGASAGEIRRVFSDVSEKVYENSGVRLVPEVQFIGEF